MIKIINNTLQEETLKTYIRLLEECKKFNSDFDVDKVKEQLLSNDITWIMCWRKSGTINCKNYPLLYKNIDMDKLVDTVYDIMKDCEKIINLPTVKYYDEYIIENGNLKIDTSICKFKIHHYIVLLLQLFDFNEKRVSFVLGYQLDVIKNIIIEDYNLNEGFSYKEEK